MDDDLDRLLDDPPAASPDALQAVLQRHRRRRTRLLGSALAVALVAGPVAGWLAAGATDDGDDVTTAAPAAEDTAAEQTPPTADGAKTPEPKPRPPGDVKWIMMPKSHRLERLFLRTTADGIAIRAYLSEPAERPPCPEGATCPPAACIPLAVLHLGLSTEAAVGQGGPALFREQDGVVSGGMFGVGEGSPVQWAAVRVGDGVARVRGTALSGAVDEMTPIDGWAVVATPVTLTPGEKPPVPLRVEAIDGSGTATELAPPAEQFPPEECRPPKPPPPPPPSTGTTIAT